MSDSPHSLDALSAIDFDDGLVVVNAAGEMRVYNELAALLWHALREGHPQDVLLEDIERASGTAARAAAADVIRSWHAPPPPPVRSGAGEHTFPPAGRQIARYAAMPGGLAIVIHAPAQLTSWLDSTLPPAGPDGATPGARFVIEALAAEQWRLSIDGRELVTTRELELVQGAIYQACLDVIHHRPEWQALIHGAAIAWAGSAIGLAAPSGSGKSTLSALLVARGWTYVAEDLLAILPHGKVAPWPLPISVKPGSVAVISAAWPGGLGEPRAHPGKAIMARMLHVPPDRCATAALPLKALVLPRYDPDGDDALQPLWPLHALARLAWDRLWIGYPLTRERVERFIRWLAAMPCYEIAYRRIEAIDAHFRHIAGGAHA